MNLSDITISYGMTGRRSASAGYCGSFQCFHDGPSTPETSPVSFQTEANDPFDKRVNSVGRVHDHVEVRCVDDNGRTVKVGESGELLTAGYCVMKGRTQHFQMRPILSVR